MMQPRNRTRSDGRTGGLADAFLRAFWSALPPVRPSAFVAASIPMANPSRFHPASRAGKPVLRSARASAYTTRDTPVVVSAHSASRARGETPRRAVITARAASRPRP